MTDSTSRRTFVRGALGAVALAGTAAMSAGCAEFLDPGSSSGGPTPPYVDPTRDLPTFDPSGAQPIPGELFSDLVASLDGFSPNSGYTATEWISESLTGKALIDRIVANFNVVLVNDANIPNPDLVKWWNGAIENGQMSAGNLRFFADRAAKAWASTPWIAGVVPQQLQYLRIPDVGSFARRGAVLGASFALAAGDPQFSSAMKRVADGGEGAFRSEGQLALGREAYSQQQSLIKDLNDALAKRKSAISATGGSSDPAPALPLNEFARQATNVSFFLAVGNQSRGPSPLLGR